MCSECGPVTAGRCQAGWSPCRLLCPPAVVTSRLLRDKDLDVCSLEPYAKYSAGAGTAVTLVLGLVPSLW